MKGNLEEGALVSSSPQLELAEAAGALASVAESQMQKMCSNSQRGHLFSNKP